MTVSNNQVMRLINAAAEELDVPLAVERARTERKEFAGGGSREVAIFTLTMPDPDDPDEQLTLECTGHQLRFLWAGMYLAQYGEASWLRWQRATTAARAS